MKKLIYYYIIICIAFLACSRNILSVENQSSENTQLSEENIMGEFPESERPYKKVHFDQRSINMVNETQKICNVHQLEMKKQPVKVEYGSLTFEEEKYIYEVRYELFPNCNDKINSFIGFGYEIYSDIFVCEQCNKDRNRWMEEEFKSWKQDIFKIPLPPAYSGIVSKDNVTVEWSTRGENGKDVIIGIITNDTEYDVKEVTLNITEIDERTRQWKTVGCSANRTNWFYLLQDVARIEILDIEWGKESAFCF